MVIIVDTSVFLNVLNVPGFNQARNKVFDEFEGYINQNANLLLPLAALFEAGNHVSQLADGGNRRRWAGQFVGEVRKALAGDAPWQPVPMPTSEGLSDWIDQFPNAAMQGMSIADLSIKKEWDAACARHPYLRVKIWSLDEHLAGYDRRP